MKSLVRHSFFFWIIVTANLFGQVIEQIECKDMSSEIKTDSTITQEVRDLLPSVDNFEYLECTITPIDPSSEYYKQRQQRVTSKMINLPYPGQPPLRGQVQHAKSFSTNWAGYVAATNTASPTPGSVNAVVGIWAVPTVMPSSRNTYSAAWIGIDGYTNGTVEQIGTSHDWVNGVQQNYAWFEMYPNPAYQINGFPVNPNDLIGAVVLHMGNGVFSMHIFNYTRGYYTAIPTAFTTSSWAQRSSAEWIVEAPFYQNVLPLANFRYIAMVNCQAVINGILAPIKSPYWQHNSIDMIQNGIYKAVTSGLIPSGAGFITYWRHE